RAALGVIRLVLENGVRMPLVGCLGRQLRRCVRDHVILFGKRGEHGGVEALEDLNSTWAEAKPLLRANEDEYSSWYDDLSEPSDEEVATVQSLLSFFHDRLKVYFRDQNIRHDVVDAVLAMPSSDDLVLVEKRAKALNAFLATEDGENLVQGFKRANNILSQAEEKDGVEYSFGADLKFAETDEEKALFAALDSATAKVAPAMGAEDFPLAMQEMAKLRAPVDAFFEAVQVNADSEILRRNRLNLLSDIRKICAQVADLTRIEG
ncbi:MAG: glycine--tRNA ligase subunit beta, partial [Pseudomonadota bacterium]